MKENFDKGSPANISTGSQKSNPLRETQVGQRTTIAKICREGKIMPYFTFLVVTLNLASLLTKLLHSFSFLFFNLEVGLDKILAMLRSEDLDVQIHAVKVVANLAAEGTPIFLHITCFCCLLLCIQA